MTIVRCAVPAGSKRLHQAAGPFPVLGSYEVCYFLLSFVRYRVLWRLAREKRPPDDGGLFNQTQITKLKTQLLLVLILS